MGLINFNKFPQLSSELFCIFNADGYALELSEAWEPLFGYSVDEIKGMHFSEFIHHEDFEKTSQSIAEIPDLIQVNNFENRYVSKDGNIVYMLWTVRYNHTDGLLYGFAKDITKTKENEFFLEKSSQLARIGGWKFNLFNNAIEWSDETYRIHGLPKKSEVTIKKALSYYSRNHKKIIFKIFKDCFKGHSFSVNLKIKIPNGSQEKWVRINGEPQFVNGKLRFLQGTYQDINDEMLNKIKLIESEERYRFALEASNDFIWDWEISTNKVYFSDKLAESLGYRAEDFNQEFFLSCMYPGDKDRLLSNVFSYLKNKDQFELEFRLKNVKSEYRWYRTKGKALFDKQGNAFRMSGSFTDITINKKKEEELQHALKTAISYQFALNKVSILVSIDCDGKIESINDQFTKTTGFTLDDVKGQPIHFLFGKAYKQSVVDKIWRSLQSGYTWEGTLKNKTKKGADFWVDMYAVPLTQAVGNVCYMFIAHDKTNEIQIMDELEEERIKTLQASKLAAIGEMAGGIAHEINNPLTIIHGYASNLVTMIENNELQSSKVLAEKIVNTSERIAKIIKSLKTLSRSSEFDNLQPIDFVEIMQDTLTFCYEKLKRNEIKLKINKLTEDYIVFCKHVEVAQVFLNLVNNACDAVEHSDKKEIVVNISKYQDNFLKVSIIDSGSGIPSAIKDKVLNPFFTTKEVGKGTGLGLSISKKIIDSHKGKLDFQTKTDGTEFYFTLPLAKMDSDHKRSQL